MDRSGSRPFQAEESPDTVMIPSFKKKWEAEYQRCRYQPSVFVACCWISGVFLSMKGSKGIADEKNTSMAWIALTWVPYFVTGALYLVCAILFSLRSPRVKDFCIKNYSLICAVTTFAIQFTVVVPKVMIEFRRTIYEPQIGLFSWEVDSAQIFPSRICIDHDPVKTWKEPKIPELNLQNAGCNNMILWGGFICEYIVVNLYPIVFRMSPGSAFYDIIDHRF